MTWQDEVDAAYRDVFPELDDTEQAICVDVPVLATTGDGSAWGRYFTRERRIEIYREVFDWMPDPENRERQLRHVIRHELHHALGETHAPQGHWRIDDRGWQYLTGQEISFDRNGLTITLPEMAR